MYFVDFCTLKMNLNYVIKHTNMKMMQKNSTYHALSDKHPGVLQ